MFEPGDDFPSVADGLEAVTVTRLGGEDAIAVAHALRQAVHTREAQRSQGRYTAADAGWSFPASEVPEPLRPGDVIVDAGGQRWTVLEVGQLARGSRWRCVARNLAVFHGLDDAIDLEKAEFAKGEGGAEEPAWQVRHAGLKARIQPVEAEIRTEHGRQTTAQRFKVFLEDTVTLDETMRIRGPDGAIYAITACRKAEAIDALMEIDAVHVD